MIAAIYPSICYRCIECQTSRHAAASLKKFRRQGTTKTVALAALDNELQQQQATLAGRSATPPNERAERKLEHKRHSGMQAGCVCA